MLAIAGSGATVGAQAGPAQDAIDPDAVALAERFAPIIMLKQQEEPCDTEGEPFVPMPVDLVLDNPEIALRQMSVNNPMVTRSPGASELDGLGEGFFLDFPGNSLSPGCLYEQDFDKFFAGSAPTIYAHVVQQPDEPDLVFVQYWFYWYYNDWNNKHESDWEGITLKFEASSVAEALDTEPVAVGFSQHEGGERADWDDPKLDARGRSPDGLLIGAIARELLRIRRSISVERPARASGATTRRGRPSASPPTSSSSPTRSTTRPIRSPGWSTAAAGANASRARSTDRPAPPPRTAGSNRHPGSTSSGPAASSSRPATPVVSR